MRYTTGMFSLAYSAGFRAASSVFGLEKLGAWDVQDAAMQQLLTHAPARMATRLNMDPREYPTVTDRIRDVVTHLMGGKEHNPRSPGLDVARTSSFHLPVRLKGEERDIGSVIGKVTNPEISRSNANRRRESVAVNTFYAPGMPAPTNKGPSGLPIPYEPSDKKVRKANPVELLTRGAEPFHALNDPQNLKEVMSFLAQHGNLDEAALRSHPYIATQQPGHEQILNDVSKHISAYEALNRHKR